MIELTPRKVGNSTGITLPPEMLAALNIKTGEPIYAEPMGDGSYKLTRYDPVAVRQIKAGRRLMDQNAEAMAALA